jgi:mRNA interferase RelE/StbE
MNPTDNSPMEDGDYRVIYSINDELVQVLVVAIAHRSEAYEP